jgi:hypothetical protein
MCPDFEERRQRCKHQWAVTFVHTVETAADGSEVVTISVTDGHANDGPELPALVSATARNFDMRDIAADKAYLSNANLTAVEAVGARPLVPFKLNSRPEGSEAWQRMWGLFVYRQREFLTHYHKRSNAESTFSAMKRKFGGSVRSKHFTAQQNEVLCKAIAYNLSVMTHAIHELGVEPDFGGAQ